MSFFTAGSKNEIPTDLGAICLSIGNFDGVHLGHQFLLSRAKEIAKSRNEKCVVLTFNPHPLSILRPELNHIRMFSIEDEVAQLKSNQVDGVFIFHFTQAISNLLALDFFEQLTRLFQIGSLVIGYDFKFGKNKEGDFQFLQKICSPKNIFLEQVGPFIVNDKIVSSSLIRKLIDEKKLEEVESFLGRNFMVEGVVTEGYKRGRSIQVPTANVLIQNQYSVPIGVYVTKTHINGKIYQSISNLGFNPTVESGNRDKKLETHIFNFNETLYGKKIKIEFLQYLRDEKKFKNLEELKKQIQLDINHAKGYFNE